MSSHITCDECQGAFITLDDLICRSCFDAIQEQKGGLDLKVEELESDIVGLNEKIQELEEQVEGLEFTADHPK